MHHQSVRSYWQEQLLMQRGAVTVKPTQPLLPRLLPRALAATVRPVYDTEASIDWFSLVIYPLHFTLFSHPDCVFFPAAQY